MRDSLITTGYDLHIWCAIRSGIPACCIKFWMDKYDHFTLEKKREYRVDIPDEVQYIPCPNCMKRKDFIDVKICDKKDFEICQVRLCMPCETIDSCYPNVVKKKKLDK